MVILFCGTTVVAAAIVVEFWNWFYKFLLGVESSSRVETWISLEFRERAAPATLFVMISTIVLL